MFRNLALYLKHSVASYPQRKVLVIPILEDGQYSHTEEISYGDLAKRIADYQHGWKKIGLTKGSRVVVLFRPSVDLYAVVISLISMGMVPVLIDTGMPKKKILMALSDSGASAIVSINALIKRFWFIPSMWRMKRFAVDGQGFGYKHLSWLTSHNKGNADFTITDSTEDDHGLITFTSGSTGRPKGADRTQGSLENQHKILRSHLPDKEGDVDMTSFPVWVFHNMCCGMTTVLPNSDLAKPGEIDPRAIYEQISECGVTRVSAAPTFMGRLTQYMVDNNLTLNNVNLAFTGGAPVPVIVAKNMIAAFPNANSKVVYGSTEAEPISSIYAQEFIEEGQSSDGYLVGTPVDGAEVCIAKLPARPVEEAEVEANRTQENEVGELLVGGHHVLKAYVDNELATKENKVSRSNGTVWHRTGDTGFFDTKGRIWLTGRVKDVVAVNGVWVQPFPLEKCIDEMDGIERSAIVQYENEVVLFVSSHLQAVELISTLTPVVSKNHLAAIPLCICEKIPMDARHNSKIDRPLLRDKIKNRAIQYVGKIE